MNGCLLLHLDDCFLATFESNDDFNASRSGDDSVFFNLFLCSSLCKTGTIESDFRNTASSG